MTKTNTSPFLKKLTITTLYIIYMFDLAAIVIVFVIFSALIIDRSSPFVPSSLPLHTRNVILGLLYASYPLTQFIGAPILGELADRFGKKVIINLSTLGTAGAFFLTALSILTYDLPLLFISRLIGGFFAGNASLAQASVSNLVAKKNRSRCMALFTIVGGFAWIIGPFLGSFLSSKRHVSWFGYDVPFWFMGLIFLVCWGIILISYPHVSHTKETQKLSISQSFKNLLAIFDSKIIVTPFLTSIFAIFGWMIVQNFLAPFLMEKFSLDQTMVGYTYAYISFCWLIGGITSMFLLKKVRPSQIIFPSLSISSLSILAYVMNHEPTFILWAGAIANLSFSISLSGFMAMFAHLLPLNMQGRLYGSWMGGFALVSAFGPALAGFIARFGINVPFTLALIVLFISACIYCVWLRRNIAALKKCEA